MPTLKEIMAAQTPKGAWTKKQLAEWGVPWPPPRGWKKALAAGKPIESVLRKHERKASMATAEIELHGLDTAEQVFFYERDFYVLSNFSAFSIRWGGRVFATSEHVYHWEKFQGRPTEPENMVQQMIREAPSAHEAFKIAQQHKHMRRSDWDGEKVAMMRVILRAKTEQHGYVRRKLLATGDRELVENSWRDDFWGWGPNRDGQNMLGRLWVEVRAELREAEPVSTNKDGWTGRRCPECRGGQYVRGTDGEDKLCGACGGTGEECRAELDERPAQ